MHNAEHQIVLKSLIPKSFLPRSQNYRVITLVSGCCLWILLTATSVGETVVFYASESGFHKFSFAAGAVAPTELGLWSKVGYIPIGYQERAKRHTPKSLLPVRKKGDLFFLYSNSGIQPGDAAGSSYVAMISSKDASVVTDNGFQLAWNGNANRYRPLYLSSIPGENNSYIWGDDAGTPTIYLANHTSISLSRNGDCWPAAGGVLGQASQVLLRMQ